MKQQMIYWYVISPMIRKSIETRYGKELADKAIQNGKAEYQKLVEQAPELGKGNPMISNAYFAYVFVGAWLGTDKELKPEDIKLVMTDVLGKMKPFFAMTDLNKNPHKWDKEMAKYQKWYDAGNGEAYPTTWKVHMNPGLHQDGSYYYFSSCPICSYLRGIGLGEIMKPLCETDSIMFAYQHGTLHRDHTIAEGSDICDYWIVGDKIKDPK